jgi:hypothetical protein
MKRLALVLVSLSACTNPDSASKAGEGKDAPAAAKPEADDAKKAEPETPEVGKTEPPKPEVADSEPKQLEPQPPDPATLIPTAPEGEVAIKPWATIPHSATWRLVAEPSEAIAFSMDLGAGVLGRAGSNWYQRSDDGQLVPTTMDVEPELPILGVWPSDAWFVQSRTKKEDDFEYIELRLMKLRGGDRWVPQVYEGGGGEQWFHPGTDHEVAPHISTRSGMLVYSDEFDFITRVAGKHPDPEIGAHFGEVVDFVESGAGNVYVLSHDQSTYYAQIHCALADESCVTTNSMKLPLSSWTFDRKVARGKHSVSVLARSGDRHFVLHHRGKSDGWLLDELPPGERPVGMWASEEGGLWTLTGEHLRWRDTESVWHDVALPEGMTKPTAALTEDRKEVWVAGQVGGATKVFAASANAAAPEPAPAP